MDADFIDETSILLEFSNSQRHVDIRYGIINFGVLDRDDRQQAREIRIAMIGTSETVEQFQLWLTECEKGVAAKKSNQPNLFPYFPGFGPNSPFNAQWVIDPRANRIISSKEIESLSLHTSSKAIVSAAVSLYVSEIQYLKAETKPDVIVCLVPNEIIDQLDRAADLSPARLPSAGTATDSENEESSGQSRHDFHHSLKAAAMPFHTPIQLVLPSTIGLGSRKKSSKKKRPGYGPQPRQLQDPATCAWNLFTALYYKAGGVPWRLPRNPSDYQSCFVGISFYKTVDERRVFTSIAQVFNQRGEGIVVRGGQAHQSKEDRTPHLLADDAHNLLIEALKRYREEHKTLPARVVLHKSSSFDENEIVGFKAALKEERIEFADLISIRKSDIRLFRQGNYPVLRGTHFRLDEERHLLFTRGSVPFYRTYPGLYVPNGLEIRLDSIDSTREALSREILSLTKMNWNSTQFDMREPITLRAARKVGDIMKYVPESTTSAQIPSQYSYYM